MLEYAHVSRKHPEGDEAFYKTAPDEQWEAALDGFANSTAFDQYIFLTTAVRASTAKGKIASCELDAQLVAAMRVRPHAPPQTSRPHRADGFLPPRATNIAPLRGEVAGTSAW
jgi:hypothetical protein